MRNLADVDNPLSITPRQSCLYRDTLISEPLFLHSPAATLCESRITRPPKPAHSLLFQLLLFPPVPFWKTCTPFVSNACNFRVTFPLFHPERLLLLERPSYFFFTRRRSFFAHTTASPGQPFSKKLHVSSSSRRGVKWPHPSTRRKEHQTWPP